MSNSTQQKRLSLALLGFCLVSLSALLAEASIGTALKTAKEIVKDAIVPESLSKAMDNGVHQLGGQTSRTNDHSIESHVNVNSLANQGANNNHNSDNSNSHNTIINNIQTAFNPFDEAAKTKAAAQATDSALGIAPAVNTNQQASPQQQTANEKHLASAIMNALADSNFTQQHQVQKPAQPATVQATPAPVPQQQPIVAPPQTAAPVVIQQQLSTHAPPQVIIESPLQASTVIPAAQDKSLPSQSGVAMVQQNGQHDPIQEFKSLEDPVHKFDMYLKPICMTSPQITEKQLNRIRMQLVQFVAHTDGHFQKCFSDNYMIDPAKISIDDLGRICTSKDSAHQSSQETSVYGRFKKCLSDNWSVMIEREIERILVNRINCSKAHQISTGTNGAFSINKLSHDDEEMALLEDIVAKVAESELSKESTEKVALSTHEPTITFVQEQPDSAPATNSLNDILISAVNAEHAQSSSPAPLHVNAVPAHHEQQQQHEQKHDIPSVVVLPSQIIVSQTTTLKPAVVVVEEAHTSTTAKPVVIVNDLHHETQNEEQKPVVEIKAAQSKSQNSNDAHDSNTSKPDTSLEVVEVELGATKNDAVSTLQEIPTAETFVVVHSTTKKPKSTGLVESSSASSNKQRGLIVKSSTKMPMQIAEIVIHSTSRPTHQSAYIAAASDASANDHHTPEVSLLIPDSNKTSAPVVAIENSDTIVLKADSVATAMALANSGALDSSLNNKQQHQKNNVEITLKAPTKPSAITTKSPTKVVAVIASTKVPSTTTANIHPTAKVEVISIKALTTTSKPMTSKDEKKVIIVDGKSDKKQALATKSEDKKVKAIKDLTLQLQNSHNEDEHERESKLHQMEHERQMNSDPIGHMLKHQKYEQAKEAKIRLLKISTGRSD